MTKTEQARIVAWRLRILRHADEEPRHVAQTCRYLGITFGRLQLGEMDIEGRISK